MVIVIVARELTITGLRLLAASKNVVLAAENFGKHKTISQIVAINALLVLDACNEWPAGAATIFPVLGADLRGNHAVGGGRTDGGVRRDLPLAQPRDLYERRVKSERGRACPRVEISWHELADKLSALRHFFGSGSVSPELAG